ncbi:MAG: alpha/beta fold hydrolase [Paracoccaceae bacterium]
MRLSSVLLMSALGLAAQSLAAQSAEEVITFDTAGGKIVGTLSLPEGGPAPVVLLFHGFTGTRNELAVATTQEGVFSRTARLLADAGYASLRIDFRGSGESDGAFADTTFEGQIADGLKAVEVMTADPRVKGADLAIIGWSQGGLVATAVAGRSGIPDAVALWAAVVTPKETFSGLLGAETVEKGLTTGDTPLSITLPWGAVIELKQGFFDGFATLDPLKEIAAYRGPLFVAQGTKDTTVAPISADKLIDAHEGTEQRFSAEMDHVFNAFTGPQTLDEMVGKTIGFFDAQMK